MTNGAICGGGDNWIRIVRLCHECGRKTHHVRREVFGGYGEDDICCACGTFTVDLESQLKEMVDGREKNREIARGIWFNRKRYPQPRKRRGVVSSAIQFILTSGVECPLTLAVGCQDRPSMPACRFDGKCCPWTTTNFPQEWLKCRRYQAFVRGVKEEPK